jgi:exosome complex component MTR3
MFQPRFLSISHALLASVAINIDEHFHTAPHSRPLLQTTANMQAAGRRRLNAPAGGTTPPVFATPTESTPNPIHRPKRTRKADEPRKIFLRTGVVPSASGSAYYEIPPSPPQQPTDLLVPSTSSLKITCSVHGPRPLPRNAAFSPNLLLTAHVNFAPFATRNRRAYVRDSSERDLGAHLETALRGVVIGERWPKSGVEVVVTVLEGEEDGWWGDATTGTGGGGSGWGMMNVLAGCMTVASAALVDAGIDCVDLVSGGVAALAGRDGSKEVVLDPCPAEHENLQAGCVVGYLQSRDEVTEVWMKGDVGSEAERLVDEAVKAASLTRMVLVEAVKEAVQAKLPKLDELGGGAEKEKEKGGQGKREGGDVVMTD